MKARYIRVSTAKQKTDRQKELAQENEILFIDVVSGSVKFEDRVQGIILSEAIKKGEVSYLTIHSIDRLGRNLIDILQTVEFLNENKVTLKVENLGIESLVNGKVNDSFKMIISVMGNIAEMERKTMLERQREGIEIAKAKGTYKGRVKGTSETKDQFLAKHKKVVKELEDGNLSLRKIAKLYEFIVLFAPFRGKDIRPLEGEYPAA